MLARLPGRIPAGSRSSTPVYFPDILPTVADLTGTSHFLPPNLDGISLAAELTARGRISHDRPMYWEWNEDHFKLPYRVTKQACRRGRWKIVRHDPARPWELYDLAADPSEKSDLASANPNLVAELEVWIRANRVDPPEQFEPSKPAGQQWR
jgi:arylsulfatase A-like enzyme